VTRKKTERRKSTAVRANYEIHEGAVCVQEHMYTRKIHLVLAVSCDTHAKEEIHVALMKENAPFQNEGG